MEFSGIGDFIELPMSTYSSGMAARLRFAISTAAVPDILVVDEALGTGDADFRARARNGSRRSGRRPGRSSSWRTRRPRSARCATGALWVDPGNTRHEDGPGRRRRRRLRRGDSGSSLGPRRCHPSRRCRASNAGPAARCSTRPFCRASPQGHSRGQLATPWCSPPVTPPSRWPCRRSRSATTVGAPRSCSGPPARRLPVDHQQGAVPAGSQARRVAWWTRFRRRRGGRGAR